MKHTRHHSLKLSEVAEEDKILCSGCEEKLSAGLAYTCKTPNCKFTLHQSCFKLPLTIENNSCHPHHSLYLLFCPTDPTTTCDACHNSINAYHFSCYDCDFDLHVKCALTGTLSSVDHQHPLSLSYSSPPPNNKKNSKFSCGVCDCTIKKLSWIYYCRECNYGSHLECVTPKEDDSSKEESDAEELEDQEEEELEDLEEVSEDEEEEGSGDEEEGLKDEDEEEGLKDDDKENSKNKEEKGAVDKEEGPLDAMEQMRANQLALMQSQIAMQDQFARLQFQTNMNRMNAQFQANLFRRW